MASNWERWGRRGERKRYPTPPGWGWGIEIALCFEGDSGVVEIDNTAKLKISQSGGEGQMGDLVDG
jgi:hypothetical protein